MKKVLFSAMIFYAISLCTYGQKYELGRVTKEELSEKFHPKDTAASAAILFKKAKTTFTYLDKNGFTSNTEFTIKIKIYKKAGIGLGDFEIPFFVGYEKLEDEFLDISQAYTYNLENGKVEKTKVTGEGKFVERVNEYWKTKSITFPNVKVGSILEIKYKLRTANLNMLPDFQYQFSIPVNYAEYITEIPEFYIYKALKSGYVPLDIKEKKEVVSQNFESMDGLAKQSHTFSYNQYRTVYTAENIPSLPEEKYVDNIKNYQATLEHELQSFRDFDKPPKQYSTTWENVAKLIFKDKEFGPELQKSAYFFDELKREFSTAMPDQEKMFKALDFVKKRMKWNGRFGYYTKVGVEKAYSEKTGNVAEINLMLTSVLREVGLVANPVLVSTRANGIALFPSVTKFNYVIAAVEIDNTVILLDATDKNALPNILPVRDLNWMGRMIKSDGSSTEVNLMPKLVSKDIVNMIATIDGKGIVTGKLKEQHFDYNAFIFRNSFGDLNATSQLEQLERKYPQIEADAYTVSNTSEFDKPVVESYSFTTTNAVDVIGDKMYFSPLFFLAINTNPFQQEIREYPVDFIYPNQDKYQISITIPDGYQIESLPKSVSIPMSNNQASLKYSISGNEKIIQLSVITDINSATFPSENYNELKSFFAEVVKKQTEKIVLKKS